MHFDGAQVSIYFATFSADYLRIIRNENVDHISVRDDKIRLNHTRLYNLFSAADRTEFISEFVALLRFVAAGEAKVGYLRKDCSAIHRMGGEIQSEPILRPPQEEMDEFEEDIWRFNHAENYAW